MLPDATPSTSDGGDARSVWGWDRNRLALIAAATVALLALVALVAVIDLPERSDERQDQASDGAGQDTQGGQRGGSSEGSFEEFPGGGRFDLGDGRDLEIRQLPGCPGGFEIGDILVVPDPEACGYELVPPGEQGFDPSGRIMLVPDANGNVGGVRLGPDGQLELLEPGEFGESALDLGIGFLPDGSVRLFRPDGSFFDLGPGDDGFTFDDPGNFFDDPEDNALEPDAAQPDDDQDSADSDSGGGFSLPTPLLWILLVVVALVVLGLIVKNVEWSRNRDGSGDDEDAEPKLQDDVDDYAAEINALDRMLWEISQEPDPRTAIRRVYAALETGLDNPEMARRRSETPGIFLRRILGRFDVLDAPLYELTELFQQARFSQHEITPAMRDRAIRSLEAVRGHYAFAAQHTREPELIA